MSILKRSTMLGLSAAFALGLALVLQAAEKKVDTSKLPPAALKAGLTFDKDVKSILETSCGKCHGGDRPKGKYVVAQRETVIKGGDSGHAAVIPGKSDQSPLIHFAADLVPDMEMPPLDKRDKNPALSKDQIALLRAWIDQGAK